MSLREVGAHPAMTIREFFLRVHWLSLYGRVFPVEEDPLSYIPVISVCNIEFKRYKNRIRFETSYQSRLLLDSFMLGINDSVLDLPFSEIDLTKTYLGISWLYLFNLRERMRDFRAPNILIYVNFAPDFKAQCLGLQLDSLSLLRQWSLDESFYKRHNQHMRDFLDYQLELQGYTVADQKIHHLEYAQFRNKFYDDC